MCARSLKCRVLISLLVVLMAGFGALALHFYDMRDQLRRSLMFIQAQSIGAGYTADSDFSTLPTQHAGSELSYSLYSPEGGLLWHSNNLEQPHRLHRGTLQEEIDLIRTTIRSGRGLVINVPVTYQFNKHITGFLGIYNVFDKQVSSELYGKTLDGRRYYAGLSMDF